MKKLKKAASLILSFLFVMSALLTSTGCLNGKSVEDYGYVLAIGIDRGEKLKYKVTFLMQGSTSSDESSQLGKMVLVSAEGPDMMTALNTAELGTPNQFNFSRMNLIAVSRDIAENGLLEEFLSFSITELQIRLSSTMIITTNKSSDFFKGLQYADTLNYSRLVESLVGFRFEMGITTAQSLSQFFTSIRSRRSDAVLSLGSTDNSIISADRSDTAEKNGEEAKPQEEDTTGGIEREGGMKSYVEGAAIFDGYKMVGVLSKSEVQLLTLALGELSGSLVSFSRKGGGFYSVRLENSRDTDVYLSLGDKPHVKYVIHVSGRLEQDTDIDRLLTERGSVDITKDISRSVTEYLKNGLYKLFYNCRDLNSDTFQLGRYAATKFSSVQEWEKYDFKSRLGDFEASFEIDLDLEDVFIASYRE